MQVIRTRHGLRLSQHGVVISELRTSPGPTHSVFDVLAALMALLRPEGKIGVLGFAGGGMLAPLQALGMKSPFATVDLDRESYDLFRRECPDWGQQVHWHHGDAAKWLRKRTEKFDLLMDDLSVPQNGDVVKPEVCWDVLPNLMRRRLKRDGVAVFNLVSPPPEGWKRGMARLATGFDNAQVVTFQEYENRILLVGNLPSTQRLGRELQRSLKRIRSRQGGRVQLKSLSGLKNISLRKSTPR